MARRRPPLASGNKKFTRIHLEEPELEVTSEEFDLLLEALLIGKKENLTRDAVFRLMATGLKAGLEAAKKAAIGL